VPDYDKEAVINTARREEIVVKKARAVLIAELDSELSDDERPICQNIIGCLTELGYTPYKENVKDFVLSFKNSEVRQTIAKIGIRSGRRKGAFFSIKFYACISPPKKFLNAVAAAMLKANGRYACCDCGVCGAGAGERGYHCAYPDGSEFIRCGAYTVEIPGLTLEDAEDFNKLLIEQHAYFSTRR
jgi:hypothetical protein